MPSPRPPSSDPSPRLKTLFDGKAEAARAAGPATERAHARVRLAWGIACDVEHGDRTMRVDLPATEGGGATGPHPGQLMRASLGACLVMGYRIWAARLEVPLGDVTLDVSCEYDPRGQLGADPSVAIGWTRLVVDVIAESTAAEAEVRRVIETANRLSPMLSNLSPHIERAFHVRVVSPERAGAP